MRGPPRRTARTSAGPALLLVLLLLAAPLAGPAAGDPPAGAAGASPARVERLPAPAGTLALLYAPEFRPADLLLADLRRYGLLDVQVDAVAPFVTDLRGDDVPPGPPAPPGRPDLSWPTWPTRPFEAPLPLEEAARRAEEWRRSQKKEVSPGVAKPLLEPTRVGSRLLLRGPAAAVEHLEAALRRLDRPAPGLDVRLLVVEVRCRARVERGGRLLYARDDAPGASDVAFQSIASDFEPDAWIRAQATGLLPFRGASVLFSRFVPLEGAYEHVLRGLVVRQEAELVAWPHLACSEGAPCGLEVLNAVPGLRLKRGVPVPELEVPPPLDTGLRLGLEALRVGSDGATLDLHVQLRSADPSTEPDALPGALVHRSRDLTTRVTVRDGQSLLLGGVTLTRRLGNRRAFPFVGTVAPLDVVTSGRGRQVERTELIVVLAPRLRALEPPGP